MWPRSPFEKAAAGDLESGREPLYPTMLESPELRWGFIRKVYSIIAIQTLVTVAAAAAIVFVRPIPQFLLFTTPGLWICAFLPLLPFLVLWPLTVYAERHPVNLILLGVFTVLMSSSIGVVCAMTSGKAILEAAVLTTVVVVSLTLYTFWAARRGHNFNFLAPFLSCSFLILLVFGFIMLLCPLEGVAEMIYGGLGAIIFSGFIIYDTEKLIRRHSCDEYVGAAVSLYLDIINIFLSLVTLLRTSVR